MGNPLGITESLPVFDLDTGAGSDLHPTIGLIFAAAGGHAVVSSTNPLPTTGGVTDTDDNSIASGQTLATNIDLNYMFDGVNWIRTMGGVDNAVAPASPQGAFVAGIVHDPLQVFADGDISFLHFDTNGRLLVNAEGVTDTDDDAIATGQTTGLSIDLPYFSNLDNAGTWERWTGRSDDDAVPSGDESPTEIGLLHVFDGTDWGRLEGGRDNEVAPATPRGVFGAGLAMTSFPAIAAGDVAVERSTDEGSRVVADRAQEPFDLGTSQAAIAASGTFTAGPAQQNSLFAGSRGRTLLSGLVHYAGAASSLTVTVQVSLDAGATFITLDTFTVTSGVALVIRRLSVAMGNRVRVVVTNNDGANATGVTNISFNLTHAN